MAKTESKSIDGLKLPPDIEASLERVAEIAVERPRKTLLEAALRVGLTVLAAECQWVRAFEKAPPHRVLYREGNFYVGGTERTYRPPHDSRATLEAIQHLYGDLV